MRTWPAALIVGLLTADPGVCGAQGTSPSGPRLAGSSLDHLSSPHSSGSPTEVPAIPLKHLLDKWQPLHERVVQDDRLRMISGVVGLGVLAYEAMPTRSHLPLELVGTEALRIGLHPQLSRLRERTGYAVEPSVGLRRFVLTFRKTIE
jgi:hypothetical protein